MNDIDIPLVDLAAWRAADATQRQHLAARLDTALRTSGFFMIGGHGVDPGLATDLRRAASRFFALPPVVKQRVRTSVDGRGWIAQGDEANSYAGEEGDASRADMKESLTFGREHTTGDDALDAVWFRPNPWPEEVPELSVVGRRWLATIRALYGELLEMLAVALELPTDHFTSRTANAPWTLNINRYPPLSEVGAALDGQFRVAPHTDWGVLTILDRQPGYGGLQVQTLDGVWVDAPYVEGAFTINVGDMLARWTGDRWRSTRHLVLPPSADAPNEELISLIMFMQPDMDQVIEPLAPPVGGGVAYPPIPASEYYLERARAATVG